MTLRAKTLALVVSATVLAAILTAGGGGNAPAAAATTGAGYSGITPYGGYLGNYIAPDGTRVYCIDSGRDWPSGATDGGAVVSSLDALSATTIRKLNYALLTWGQTGDPTNAAAVSAYVYAYTSNFAHTTGAGYAAGLHYINGNAAVSAAYNVVWNEAETRYAGESTASATVSVAMANSFDGSVTVTTQPASASGTLTLSGAVVAGTGNSSVTVTNGSVIPIRGVNAADASSYSISATAAFTVAAGAQQNLVVYSTGSQQRTIRGAFTGSVSFSASDATAQIPLTFSPVVGTTVAARLVDHAGAFIDTVVASVAADSPQWNRLADGAYAPVLATGTLYGPFTEQPDVSASPPAGAPVVGVESLTLAGPGEYVSQGTLTAPGAGFYAWIWTIDAARQTPGVAALLPAGYVFSDQFGLVAESHVVPMSVSATSRVTAADTGFGGEIGDELAVTLEEGSWLTEHGAPLEAVFEGTAYFVAGEIPPTASATVPADAVAIGTSTVAATGPGIFSAASTVTAPEATAGFVTWVWTLSSTSEFAAYFEPWSDWFGLPNETTRVAPPTVATQAQAQSAIGDEVHDTAMVGGTLPAKPANLVFQAYLQASGAPATCDESTLVFDSQAVPVAVSAVGSYDSPVTRFEQYGTYFWVESLWSHDGHLIHRGECGLAEETTLVAPGVVITQAVMQSQPGDEVHDTAYVSGLLPRGATLVFEAYAQHGVVDGPLCDATTLVFTSDAVRVTAPGHYESPSARLTDPGTYYWVETMLDRNGEPLHIGGCGVASETTAVQPLSLASTGAPAVRATLIALALLFVGIAAVGTPILSRRREYR